LTITAGLEAAHFAIGPPMAWLIEPLSRLSIANPGSAGSISAAVSARQGSVFIAGSYGTTVAGPCKPAYDAERTAAMDEFSRAVAEITGRLSGLA
jgi:hypothetical protein